MSVENIKTVAVIGSGTMGSQIAMVSSLGGYQVFLHDSSEESLKRAETQLHGHMSRWKEKGRISEEGYQDAFARLVFTSDLAQAASHADLIIEAVPEKLELKRQVFEQLDALAPKHAILATNSSFIPSSKIVDVTKRPEQVCNMHFFHPVLVMQFVEVVQGPHTSEVTAKTAYQFCKKIGKTPVHMKKEIEGFIANRILNRIIEEAFYLVENGVATIEEVDLACTKALNHPIGPFALLDLSGLDIGYYNAMDKYKETGDEKDLPHPLLRERVERGDLGRKTGKGFYDYTEKAATTK
ncbi:3-hydroxyacyl-CoA dehydrogenase family protein [Aneurinibacillus sp. Ricciae_BoGa-3]|uniref:3-hydroxyacyl-CoA dehydrogenase family protein n=1 Tax=Aneurinibacillus sp. Ricciae_BoGa-3 TaxID=3022697 RepID=UPI00233FB269|nr:3-hydroxyacyl-CoA dehydrogenase family protein [Aneurinibacillus sp. Ricciae_BoGa-3]WCK54403.1 3-hydroxyacyl-CoA dehydrogenase family protein [Aneurinibacillus sp. Ricciae_BoGa-3]